MSAIVDEADAVRRLIRAARLAADEPPTPGPFDEPDQPLLRFARCARTDPWLELYRRWLNSPRNDGVDPEPPWGAADDAALERLSGVDVGGLAALCHGWLEPLADAAARLGAGIGAAEIAVGHVWTGGSGTAAASALQELARCCGIAAESWSLLRARADELVTRCGATVRGLVGWDGLDGMFLRHYEYLAGDPSDAHAALDRPATVPDDPRAAEAVAWLDDYATRYRAAMRAYRDMVGRTTEALDEHLATFAEDVRGLLSDLDPFSRVGLVVNGAAAPSPGHAGATVASSAGDGSLTDTTADSFAEALGVTDVPEECEDDAPAWDWLGGHPRHRWPWWDELMSADGSREPPAFGSGEPVPEPASAFGEGRSPGEASAFELSQGRPDSDDPRPAASPRDQDERDLGGRNPDLWW